MSKKHFNAIAKAMNTTRPLGAPIQQHSQWLVDIGALAATLEQFNPGFDPARFIAACKGE